MTNYPLVKQAGIIRYPPPRFLFPDCENPINFSIKKTENRSNLYLFGFADYDTLPSVFGTPVTSARLAVSRFRLSLLRYAHSVFPALSPDTRKIRVSGNKSRLRLCRALYFCSLPSNARLRNRPVVAVETVK